MTAERMASMFNQMRIWIAFPQHSKLAAVKASGSVRCIPVYFGEIDLVPRVEIEPAED